MRKREGISEVYVSLALKIQALQDFEYITMAPMSDNAIDFQLTASQSIVRVSRFGRGIQIDPTGLFL